MPKFIATILELCWMLTPCYHYRIIIASLAAIQDSRQTRAGRSVRRTSRESQPGGYRKPDSNENHKGQVNCGAIAAKRLQNARARRNSVVIAVRYCAPVLQTSITALVFTAHLYVHVYKYPTNTCIYYCRC